MLARQQSDQYSLGPVAASETASHASADAESDEDEKHALPQMAGMLSKWTNYFLGWQDRYVTLSGGVLSYFKCAEERDKLCRGTMDVTHATFSRHDFDNLRFDITLNDLVFHFRAESNAEREQWVETLTSTKRAASGASLQRVQSTLSLISAQSVTSNASVSKARSFADKVAEVRSLREILVKQGDALLASMRALDDDGAGARAELGSSVLSFKATSSGLLESVEQLLESAVHREEEWQRRYERMVERRRRVEQAFNALRLQKPPARPVTAASIYNNPDALEGPHMGACSRVELRRCSRSAVLNEDEFFDALETQLDQFDADAARKQRGEEVLQTAKAAPSSSTPHRFSAMLDEQLRLSLVLAREPAQAPWQAVHEDGEMKVYRRDAEEGGIPCDRLKAQHFVPGLTARELLTYFYDTKVRMEWEHTIDSFDVLEVLNADTLVFHNIHKRVWPSVQRDCVILSHIVRIDDSTWCVSNMSVEHEGAPQQPNKYVRLVANVFFMATTECTGPADAPVTRQNVGSRVVYLASVNPGGWAPAAAVQAISKREYPRFLRNFSKFATKHYEGRAVEL